MTCVSGVERTTERTVGVAMTVKQTIHIIKIIRVHDGVEWINKQRCFSDITNYKGVQDF